MCDTGVPRCVRIDAGTENILVEDIQMAFRWDNADDMSAPNSVIKGSSHSNQVCINVVRLKQNITFKDKHQLPLQGNKITY